VIRVADRMGELNDMLQCELKLHETPSQLQRSLISVDAT
jgi:hypothetical protein